MGNITFGGLASGLDTNSIIAALGAAERSPITTMQSKQRELRTQLSTISTVTSRLTALKAAAESLATTGGVLSLNSSSADSSRVGVSVTSSASAGSFSIDDVVLATGQKSRSSLFDAKTSAVGTGILKITQGGTTYNITIDSGNNTIEGVAASLNAASGLSLTANLFYDGSKYRILATSDGTGTSSGFTVDDSGLTGGSTLHFGDAENSIQTSKNGSFTLDGQTVTTQSNTVTDALSGVTLTLKKEFTDSAVQIDVGTDADAMIAKVRTLVSAYNSAYGLIKDQFTYTGGGKQQVGSPLFGDSTIRSAQQRLSSLSSSVLPGHSVGSQSLSEFGVTVDRAGAMSIDETKLRERITADPRALSQFFVDSGSVKGFASTLVAAVDEYVDTDHGLLDAKQDSINSRITDFDTRIAAREARAVAYEAGLRKQFTALEGIMSKLQSQSTFLTQNFTTK